MDNMVGKIRILLADSDGDFCAEMAALCEDAEDMELVGIAESGEKALTAVGELRPDLLITELSLPGREHAGGVCAFGIQQYAGLRRVREPGRGCVPAQADRGGKGL